MCGISGLFNFLDQRPVAESVLTAMTKAISHRGPDDLQILLDHELGLGFVRLSLIDLASGRQPLVSNDGRFTLVFNGEIYNYKELRADLEVKGYSFKTNGDAEVILALFATGVEYPEKQLRGMFSFAIFDNIRRSLILSRDRLGKKPLFWQMTSSGIVFGSEIKSILHGGGQKASPNWASISDFLTLGYIPGGQTAFEGVHHVLPGSRLVIDTDVKEDVWWNLPSSKESDKEERSDWDEVILIHLKESIKYRLISDVPIGLFLSGGLDSALMLALIKEVGLPDEFVAYTVGFNSESYDETQAATLLADYYKVDHKAIKMEAADIERIFSDVVYKSDNLIANPAIFANYLLSEKASKDVKAVLNGGGGDELFFGYETYKADTLAKKLEFVPQFVRGLIAAVVSAIPTDYKKLGFKYKAVKFLEGLEYEPMKRHYSWRTIFTEKDKDKLLSEGVVRHDSYKAYKDAYSLFNGDDFYESLAFADLKVWWGDMGLYQGDVMSMANSLELRMPFMDQGLVELVAKIPRKSKYDGTELKSLMKKVCQRFLPLEVLNRPKSGFHLPLAEWFAGPLKQFMLDGLSADNLSSIPQLNPKEVNKVIEDHLSKRHDNSFKIINLLVLVEWHKQFITH